MDDPLGPRLRRANQIGRVAAAHAARTTAVKVASPIRSDERTIAKRDDAILRFADDMVAVLGSMKGAALKVGQIIAMLDFGLSSSRTREEFSRRLAPLFSDVPPAEWSQMRQVLSTELGHRLSRLDIDPVPIAAASVGQVYRAVLDGKRDVAVKVQYPGIDATVRADLKNLKLLSRIGGARFPGTDLRAMVNEIAYEIGREIDYRSEAANQTRARSLCDGHPVWAIPQVYSELSSDRVLASEFFTGHSFAEVAQADQETRNWAGEAIYRFYSGNVYTRGEFCADPHPGNIMMLDDGRLGFLDFGLYVRMPADALEGQLTVLRELMEGRYHQAYQAWLNLGVTSIGDIGEEEAVELMKDVGSWFLTEDEVTITGTTTRRAVVSMFAPGALHVATIRQTRLPVEHIFSRRTDLAVCGLLGQLNAINRWGAIAREWTHGRRPVTAMGATIDEWAHQGL